MSSFQLLEKFVNSNAFSCITLPVYQSSFKKIENITCRMWIFDIKNIITSH